MQAKYNFEIQTIKDTSLRILIPTILCGSDEYSTPRSMKVQAVGVGWWRWIIRLIRKKEL